ncbi:phosphoglycolate phosphatase [Agaribacterium haliotis]|uniref:phosphoglycolate phosphatase n=1 Tax=Agaribacterium haliotis TaxID=2013869 RepID=UPI000BB59CA8|nr:phosphoglycolate phosphatase [Agaribacterium haliotis]
MLALNNIDALFFDLDGTLVDSVPDLAIAVNNMLSSLDRPPYSVDEIRKWVGNGAEQLVKRALSGASDVQTGLSPQLVKQALASFFSFYEQNYCAETIAYDGVVQTLRNLAGDYKLAIITNKPDRFIAPIIDALDMSGLFDVLVGFDSLPQAKPAPEPLLYAAEKLNVDIERCVMIGDSKNDILAAKAANVTSIGVSYGYNYGVPITAFDPDFVIDQFSELTNYLR